MRYYKCLIVAGLLATAGFAETKTFIDAKFPYRVVCASNWVEQAKNDTLFSLKDATPNKKTQMQLRRYPITDTTYSHETMNWSRLSYAINRELATGLGRVIDSDTSANKKISGVRAFELFAIFSQETNGIKTFWAEYCRWTEKNRFGYLVSIIGDTLDLKKNFATYKTVLDSVDIKEIPTTVATMQPGYRTFILQSTTASRMDYDLLGRVESNAGFPRTMLIIKNGKTTVQLRELHAR